MADFYANNSVANIGNCIVFSKSLFVTRNVYVEAYFTER